MDSRASAVHMEVEPEHRAFPIPRGESFFCPPSFRRSSPVLPSSVEPYPEENFESYLFRVAERNAVPTIAEVMQALHLPLRRTYAPSEHEEICFRLDYRLRDLVPKEPVPSQHKAKFAGQWIRVKHLMPFATRLCPQCLAEDGYGRISWKLLPVPVCDRHGTYLLDSCSCSPGRAIGIRRPCYAECECGTDFRSIVTRSASAEARSLARLVAWRLLDEPAGESEHTLDGLASIPREISISELLDIVVVLGGMDAKTGKLGPRHSSLPSGLQQNIDQFERAAQILANWPDSLLPSIRVLMAPTASGELFWSDPSDRHAVTRRYLEPILFQWIADAQTRVLQDNLRWMLMSLSANLVRGGTCSH